MLARPFVQLLERDLADDRWPRSLQANAGAEEGTVRRQASKTSGRPFTITNVQVEGSIRPMPETAAMAIVPFPIPPSAQARTLLHHLLEYGDIVGRDAAGRTVIQLAVNDYVLETLMTFDAEAAELEPEPDDEDYGAPVLVELVRPNMVERKRALASGGVD